MKFPCVDFLLFTVQFVACFLIATNVNFVFIFLHIDSS